MSFNAMPKKQLPITSYNHNNPYRIIYVSIIDQYKHQCIVVEAIAGLRKLGLPIVLDLVGPAFPPALKRLNKTLNRFDVDRKWVFYHGAIPFTELHKKYSEANLGLFASSCENMPNILIEMMASGLPIVCSNLGPMPEILGPGGLYFDPESAESITSAIFQLTASTQLRKKVCQISYNTAKNYSWRYCSNKTFAFLELNAKE